MTKLIWWTNQTDCETIGAMFDTEAERIPSQWPEYLRKEFGDRCGRNGRGRLWVPSEFMSSPEAVLGIHPWPGNLLGNLLGGRGAYEVQGDRHSAGGIMIDATDLRHVIHLPGIVTDMKLQPLQAWFGEELHEKLVDLVREHMMSTDHPVSEFETDFAADVFNLFIARERSVAVYTRDVLVMVHGKPMTISEIEALIPTGEK